MIVEQGLVDRGIAWTGAGHPLLLMPDGADSSWLTSEAFLHRFDLWSEQVSQRPDVFLGYCSESRETAQAIHLFLSDKARLKVLNWEMDFSAGATILDEIERAARLCSAGILLFTKDDALEGGTEHAAPRDNVVFEAGYFASARGRTAFSSFVRKGQKCPRISEGTFI